MKLLILLLGLFSLPLNAATTGTLTISGTVATVYSIVVTPNGSATNLNILSGESNLLVATVDETSNNAAGYKISISSTNAGKLVNGTSQLNYTLSYDGGSSTQLTGSPVTRKTSGTLTGLTTDVSNVNISFSALPSAIGGTYSDTVTFTIGAP